MWVGEQSRSEAFEIQKSDVDCHSLDLTDSNQN